MPEDNQDNLVLERLREIRAVLDHIQTTQSEHGRRLTGIDLRLADMQRTIG